MSNIIKDLKKNKLPYIQGDKIYNTHHFSATAQHKVKTGRYCPYKPKSKAQRDFWVQEWDRCLNGITIGGVTITGYHYHFLNYTQMDRVSVINNKITKERGFPSFWKIHYDWFHAVETAETEGKHLVVLKPRRAGWSYIAASMGARDFSVRLPGSTVYKKSFYCASAEDYLIGNGVLDKVWDNLEFHNKETDGGLKHLRQVFDQKTHKRASKLDRGRNETWTGGEIIGKILDNPHKARGISAHKIYLEEFGSFKKGKEAFRIIQPTVEEGGYVVGQIIAYGTGGEEGPGIESLEDMFYNPDAYNMMGFDNSLYEDNLTHSGFFFPCYLVMPKYMDENGNPDIETAKKHEEAERKIIQEKSKDPKDLDRYKSEKPFAPSEAFKQTSTNLFNPELLSEQYKQLKITPPHRVSGELKWIESSKGVEGVRFEERKDGRIHLLEHPVTMSGRVPDNLYIAAIDSIDYGTGNTMGEKGSDFCMVIKKRINGVSDKFSNSYVAYIRFRPYDERDAYKVALQLSWYYNCKINLERSRKEIINYFRNPPDLPTQEHRFIHQPTVLESSINIKKARNLIGTPPTAAVNQFMDNLLKDYIQDYSEHILFEEFLVEARDYDRKKRTDYDLIVAWGLCELLDNELLYSNITAKKPEPKTKASIRGYYKDANGNMVRGEINQSESFIISDNNKKPKYIDRTNGNKLVF